jgi:hypothetical protein
MSADTLKTLQIASSSPFIRWRIEQMEEASIIHVTLDDKAPVGLLRANLYIQQTQPKEITFRIPVVAEVTAS